ncbi:MAG: hypothetical protein Q4D13_06315 [Erysipelotrichaceae bacterium]|nr:hypothetical protein [Erysipelotrichaceae bacterium]
MELKKIESDLKTFLDEKGRHLFEVKYHKKDTTLSILLDDTLNMDELEKISEELSEYMDKYEDEFEDNYILDVSTVGVERPIRNEDDLIKAVGSYIYVKTKENEYNGTLKEYKDGIMTLEVKDKTRKKDVSIEYKNTKKVRYAVEF